MLKDMRANIELEGRTPNQRINLARSELINADFDIKKVVVEWTSDQNRATTDISINEIMRAHLLISEAIRALNAAQAHTQE